MADLLKLMCKMSLFEPLSVISQLTEEIITDIEISCTNSTGRKINNINLLSTVVKNLHLTKDKHMRDTIVSAHIPTVISDVCFPLLLELHPTYDRGRNCLSSVASICNLLLVSMEISPDNQVVFVLNKCDHLLDVWLVERPCVYDQNHAKEQHTMDIICILEILKTVFSVAKCQLRTKDIFENCSSLFDSILAKLLNVMPHVPNKVISRIVFTVIATLLRQDRKRNVLRISKLWNTVKMFVSADELVFLEQSLLIVCSLADFFFPVSGFPLGMDLRCSGHFWELVQQAIVHVNPITRKRAMYLLKRIMDICETQSVELPDGMCPMFTWKKTCQKEFSKTWQDVVLILETLEEKQVCGFTFRVLNSYNIWIPV